MWCWPYWCHNIIIPSSIYPTILLVNSDWYRCCLPSHMANWSESAAIDDPTTQQVLGRRLVFSGHWIFIAQRSRLIFLSRYNHPTLSTNGIDSAQMVALTSTKFWAIFREFTKFLNKITTTIGGLWMCRWS